MLSFDKVSAHYGKIQALHEVSLHINQGEIVTLIGANGAGKTTLLGTLCGDPRATSGRIGLLEHANRQASNLAYGDQRRLEIARCMVTQPEILMLDEPAAGLNPKETKELDELIAELRNHHNTTILLIEHDMKLVMGISDRIYVVNQGTPLANGTPEQIRNNPDVIRAYLGEA
ncbi:ATP-binding cassette domain-containing protein [Escherichia coli]